MKRKLLTVLLAAALLSGSAVPVLAAEISAGGNGAAVVAQKTGLSKTELTAAVKAKLTIPEIYSKFTINSREDEKKAQYDLSWESEDDSKPGSIRVTADESGNILRYTNYVYDRADNEGGMVTDDRAKVEQKILSQVQTLLPECFTETDTYRRDTSTFSMQGNGTIAYRRFHDGVRVWDNEIHVEYEKAKEGYRITHLTSNHDYDAQFGENTTAEASKDSYRELAKSKLEYDLIYDYDEVARESKKNPVLRYVISNAPFMDPATGEEIKQDISEDIEPYPYRDGMSGGGASSSLKNETADMLTDEELAEIENVNHLKSAEERVAELRAIPELGLDQTMQVRSKRITKDEDRYCMELTLSDDQEDLNKKYCSVSLNAETGKLISFWATPSKYKGGDTQIMTEDELKGASGEDFLKKYGDGFEDYALDEQYGYKTDDMAVVTDSYIKTINGIPFPAARATISYNPKTKQVSGMYISDIKPDGEFPDPAKAVSEKAAFDTIIGVYPLESVFVKSDGIYRKAVILPSRTVYLDAISNMVVNGWDNTPIEDFDKIYQYDDISGHWAEQMIRTLGQFGIGLEGNSFLPDEEITAGDFTKLVEATMGRYAAIIGIRKNADGANADQPDDIAPVTREEAAKVIVQNTVFEELANMPDIFVTHFDDEQEISTECLASCAIAKGLGIISGSDGKFYPKKNITRAEAIAMLYRYKIRWNG